MAKGRYVNGFFLLGDRRPAEAIPMDEADIEVRGSEEENGVPLRQELLPNHEKGRDCYA